MIFTLSVILVITAFVTTIIAMMGKCPLWVPVMVLSVFALIQVIPIK